jgi:hypothetical protein
MADNIRDKARTWIEANVPEGAVYYSDGPTAKKFTELTGYTHQQLEAFWKAHEGIYPKGTQRPVLTSCNGFTGVYSRAIGLPNLGVFDFPKRLKELKKEYAWVPSTPDVEPKYGDILRHKAFHVDVFLSKDGDTWYSVDGGQGGPHYNKEGKYTGGRDIVKRVTHSPDDKPVPHPYNPDKLIGWVDIELFVGSAGPPPSPQGAADAGATGSLWLNEDGELVHPGAPAGRGGPGNFRHAGVLHANPFVEDLLHPWAPPVLNLDPAELG